MKIGELALKAQCTVETVRYYEKEGLINKPGRTAGNYREYAKDHVERLRFIRNCRALDMTHSEIRTLLGFAENPIDSCGEINVLLDEHIGHVEERVRELKKLKRQLVDLRHRCNVDMSVDACGILQGLASMTVEPKQERHTHLG
jgi:Cd(II)/Pb(II)-responsive transcriptional regulator